MYGSSAQQGGEPGCPCSPIKMGNGRANRSSRIQSSAHKALALLTARIAQWHLRQAWSCELHPQHTQTKHFEHLASLVCRRWFNSRALRGCLGCLLRCREQRAHHPCVPHGRKRGVNPGAHAHPSEWEWDVQIALLESNRELTMLWHPFRPMWQNGIYVKHGRGSYTHNTHKPNTLGILFRWYADVGSIHVHCGVAWVSSCVSVNKGHFPRVWLIGARGG